VQHVEWEKLPPDLLQQNLCRDCYGAAVPKERHDRIAEAVRIVILRPDLVVTLVSLLFLLIAIATCWAWEPLQQATLAGAYSHGQLVHTVR